MNDLALVLCKMLGVTNDAVIESGANGQQYITVLHGVVGFYRSVHAQHAQKLAITRRVGAQAHQCVGARVAQHINQRAQFGGCITQQHPAARIYIGALCGQQQLQSLANLPAMPFANGVVGAHFHRLRIA